jgi:hypothetical protein
MVIILWGIGGLFMALFSVAFLSYAVTESRLILRRHDYIRTRGVITRSQMESRRDPDSSFAEKYEYSVHVEYEYSVSDTVLVGDRVSLLTDDPAWGDAPTKKAVVQRYLVGAPVTVFFDPEKPNNSTLSLDYDGWTVVAIWFAAAFCGGISAWMLWRGLSAL